MITVADNEKAYKMEQVVIFTFKAKEVEDIEIKDLVYQASKNFSEFDFLELSVMSEERYDQEMTAMARKQAQKLMWRPNSLRRGQH